MCGVLMWEGVMMLYVERTGGVVVTCDAVMTFSVVRTQSVCQGPRPLARIIRELKAFIGPVVIREAVAPAVSGPVDWPV
jgi:hypothetical protein